MTDRRSADRPATGAAGPLAPDRDAGLVALRPAVPSADPGRADGPVEALLHGTLRPVLKLRSGLARQNDALLALVAAHVGGLVKGFAWFAPDDRRDRLAALLKKDTRLKRTLVGAVLGVLTADELAFALANESDVRRRVVALVAERVSGQADAVAERVARVRSAL
ncbi:MAG TPA: hypothetical protein VF576_08255 [Rubricoccaceae bacterium]